MLWDLTGEGACQVFNAWNTAVKLSWDCPRDTRTYLVQQVLACDQTTARNNFLARYGKFFKSLRSSTSKEVANLVSRDIQSTTGTNLKLVESSSGLSAWEASQVKLKEAMRKKETVTVENSLLGQITG